MGCNNVGFFNGTWSWLNPGVVVYFGGYFSDSGVTAQARIQDFGGGQAEF